MSNLPSGQEGQGLDLSTRVSNVKVSSNLTRVIFNFLSFCDVGSQTQGLVPAVKCSTTELHPQPNKSCFSGVGKTPD
jgi:hypothetical protein